MSFYHTFYKILKRDFYKFFWSGLFGCVTFLFYIKSHINPYIRRMVGVC